MPFSNPAPNPSGFIEAGVNAANAAARYKQGLQAAMYQQVQYDQEQEQKRFEAELKLRQDGYVPADQIQQTDSGLKQRSAAPDATPQNTLTDPWNRRWYKPSTPQKGGELTLDQALTKGGERVDENGNIPGSAAPLSTPDAEGNWQNTDLPGTPLRPDQNRVFDTQGGQKFYIPTEQDNLQSKLSTEAANREPRKPEINTKDFSAPVMIDEKGNATEIQLPAGVTRNEKSDKPEKFTYNHYTDDSGRVNITRIGEDGTPQKWDGKQWATLGAGEQLGPKRKDPDAAADSRKSAADQKRIDAQQKSIEALQTKEQAQHELRRAYGQALSTPDGQTVVDPDSKKGFQMTPARRAYYQGKFQKATDMAGVYHSQQQKILGTDQPAQPGAPTRHAQYNPGPATRAAESKNTPTQNSPSASAPQQGPPQRAQQTQGAKKTAAKLPTGHKVGDTVRLRNGTTAKITQVYADGTFDYAQ